MPDDTLSGDPAALEVAIAQAPIAIVILRGPDLVVEVANPHALRSWGRTSDAGILGRPLFEAVPEVANQGFEALLQRVRTTGEMFVGRELPLTVVDAAGHSEQRFIDRTYSRLSTGEHILAIGTDVTDSVRKRDRLRADVVRAEHRLHTQFMQAPVAVSVVTGPRFVYEHANPLYLEMIGRTAIVGRSMFEVFPELPPTAPVFAMLETILTTGQPYRADELCVPIDRGRGGPEDTYFKFSCQPIRGESGAVDAIMTVAVDVTAQVSARQRSEELARELRAADQRKDEFLAMLAHELRNPMAAVSTAISLLEQVEGDPERSAKYRDTARRQMTNLVRLVDDLLDVSRITRGKIELRCAELDLAAIVQQALSATRPAFEARGHELATTLASGGFRMSGDATRLEQIVVNLLTNAAKYTDPNGRVDVHLTRERSATGTQAVLRVRDSGRGIPPDMLDRVFDLFVQVTPSIDRRTGGLGLGLTLVKRLAEMHGGSVSATSAGPGTGSEFVVRLPLLDRVGVGTPRYLEAIDAPAAQSRRILLVEDADDVRDTLSAYLRGLGHEVHVARDGVEGVARIAELHPDVAFVDIGLPLLDGFEVARRARAGSRPPYLVALTGYGGEDARTQAREAGFDLHLTKPVDLATLPRLIDRAGRPTS